MDSFIAFSVLSALTASVSAIPFSAHQAHQHLHVRKNFLKHDVTPIAGRQESLPIAPLGQCGGDSGFGCAEGFCCSKWGYCGQTEDYCGTGCQFGACFGNSSAPAPTANAPTATAPAGTAPAGDANSSTVSIAMITKAAGNGPPAGYTNSPAQTVDTSDKGVPTSAPAQDTTFATVYAPSSSAPTPPAFGTPESSSAEAAPTTAAPTTAAPVATSSVPAVPSYSAPSGGSSGGSGKGDTYTLYSGDGTTSAGWPSMEEWMDFESLWQTNMQYISISCSNSFQVPDNTDEESNDLKSAIQAQAQETGVDERFILAVVMQESKGCVRAPTTNNGVINPGLMQDHDGSGSCNKASIGGQVMTPCPSSEITQMIKDGTSGTSQGDGLKQCITQAGCDDVSKYYKAGRIYNSGRVDATGNLDAGIATHCYASDIANRLTGWVTAETQCNLG